MLKKIFRCLIAVVIIAVLGFIGIRLYIYFNRPSSVPVFRLSVVSKGDVTRTISATGTVEPEELVNVGAQVGGMITDFACDADGKPVDYGSRIVAGQVLAHIDDALYIIAHNEALAQQKQAEAAVASAKADIQVANAKLLLAQQNYDRNSSLFPKGSVAKSDYDASVSELTTCKAQIAVAEASLLKAEASLLTANEAVAKAVRNLGYCVINSPVDGVVIDRRVSIGQTVNASMNAPSLFLIAKDLRRMQVWVSVNEADVGEIKPGMKVKFKVDAFPGEEFSGEVHRIRLNATMSQNVVTYVVEVTTDNSSLRLLPYLTATVKFILAEANDVLTVPNAALRFVPEERFVAPRHREYLDFNSNSEDRRVIWVQKGEILEPVIVDIGLNDGNSTEISGDIREDMPIVVGVTDIKPDDLGKPAAGSPFMPKPPKRRNTGVIKKSVTESGTSAKQPLSREKEK